MASVIFRKGDIFEQGADLTVLPCSAKGHISKTTEKHVASYDLPLPSDNALGEIKIHRFPGAGSITRYIAWAVSVLEYKSSIDIIRTIGQRLGQYANDNQEIQLIECPLLGTGAGGLDALVAGPAIRDGFMEMCTSDAMLVIYAQQEKIIEALRNNKMLTDNTRQGTSQPVDAPTAFLSYSWESDEHKDWVRDLAARLRGDGVDVKLDQWHAVPGDQLSQFMEREIRENDYVLIICTPNYRKKSDDRSGGVGYEGDVMTAEVYTSKNDRKFIPILAKGPWNHAAPSWLKGKYHIDLSDVSNFQRGYDDLITTMHGTRVAPPPLGQKPSMKPSVPSVPPPSQEGSPTPVYPASTHSETDQPIKILGVIADEVTEPSLDGTPGSALYRIPFRLSKRPTSLWSDLFIQTWNHPPRYTSMHRPRIATVTGNKIILDGTTIEEVEKYHRDTLVLCVSAANEEEKKVLQRRKRDAEVRHQKSDDHRTTVKDVSKKIKFD